MENNLIFQLKKKPPPMPLNNYLLHFKRTGEVCHFNYFLHSFEKQLNFIISKFANRYNQLQYFDDLKFVYVSRIYELLADWNFEENPNFLYVYRFDLKDSLIKFVSEMGGIFSVNSDSHFKAMRRVAFLYSNTVHQNGDELLQYIADETKLSVSTVIKLLVEASVFANPQDIYKEDEDGFFYPYISNPANDVEFIVSQNMLLEEVVTAIDNLPFKEREVFLKSIGINCHYCGSLCKRQTYLELANRFQLSNESAAEKLNKKARLFILEYLADKHILDFVSATKKSETKKIATYTYLPQADKSAYSGTIVIDKSDFSFRIETIAELDTMRSTRYVKKVVEYLKQAKDFSKNFIYIWKE